MGLICIADFWNGNRNGRKQCQESGYRKYISVRLIVKMTIFRSSSRITFSWQNWVASCINKHILPIHYPANQNARVSIKKAMKPHGDACEKVMSLIYPIKIPLLLKKREKKKKKEDNLARPNSHTFFSIHKPDPPLPPFSDGRLWNEWEVGEEWLGREGENTELSNSLDLPPPKNHSYQQQPQHDTKMLLLGGFGTKKTSKGLWHQKQIIGPPSKNIIGERI